MTKPDLRCSQCRKNKCHFCLDKERVARGMDPACPCTRKNHPKIEVPDDALPTS